MGGSDLGLISSVIGLVSGVLGGSQKPDVPDRSAELAAQRKAQEEEQRRNEADQRKRERDKVMEARELDKKRLAAKNEGQTTLMNGGAGLLAEPEVEKKALKTKLGE